MGYRPLAPPPYPGGIGKEPVKPVGTTFLQARYGISPAYVADDAASVLGADWLAQRQAPPSRPARTIYKWLEIVSSYRGLWRTPRVEYRFTSSDLTLPGLLPNPN